MGMKIKKALWLSLAITIPLALSPLAAVAQQDAPPPSPPPDLQSPQAPRAPQPPPPPVRDRTMDTIHSYRLTYTLTEMDGEKRLGWPHYAFVLDTDAPPASLKLGTQVRFDTGPDQYRYIDIDLNIRASLRQFANGLQLRTYVEQTDVDAQQLNTKGPMSRHASLESAVLLNVGQPVVLGEFNMPSSSHHMQITVVLSKVP